ncbi:MAG: phage portal protein [Pseudonocardia sp.]|nr:phage portal protein [Pseudonocardia sp.]
MPLPAPGTQWPPPAHLPAYEALGVWSAWYSSDRDQLARVYSRERARGDRDRPSQYRNGIVGRAARWFWGEPQGNDGPSSRLHVPLAADICGTSANMLFSERPAFVVDGNEEATKRLDEVFGERAIVQLHEAAEVQAALAGVYLIAGFDTEIADMPLTTVVHPDSAIPEWRAGRLAAVTFHKVVARDDRTGIVWRHLEHHGRGFIEHALYEGRSDNIGRPVPLTDQPETSALISADMAEDGTIPTELDRLDVTYVPNAVDRRFRSDPIAHHLGRPDIQGIEPVLDALDESWTSWIKDLRLGAGKIHVPTGYLENHGPGKGASFDHNREVYVELNALNPGGAGLPITATQLAIRLAEHQGTCDALSREAVSDAGYSPATFGMGEVVAITATEVEARERKTLWLRGQKERRWKLALADHAENLTEIDKREFEKGTGRVRPDIQFPPYVSAGPLERAQTVQLMDAAGAASKATLVATQHPGWDKKRVDAEVAELLAEVAALAPADPMGFDRSGPPA